MFKTLLLIFLLSITVCYSQPTCESCKLKSYPYIGCNVNTGQKEIRCLDNPLNTPGFKVWSKCLSSFDFTYDPSRLRFQQDIKKDGYVVFSPSSVESQLRAAFNRWKEICSPITPPADCQDCGKLKIRWARDEEEMLGHSIALAVVIQDVSGENCEMDCEESALIFNSSPRRVGFPAPGQAPEEFFFTDEPDPKYYYFVTVARHEIGHWLGFGHPHDEGINCGDDFGIMGDYSAMPGLTGVTITDEDKCMFMKLYCCPAPTGIEDDNKTNSEIPFSFELFPNPANNNITLELSEEFIGVSKTVTLVNNNGETVFEKIIPAGANNYSVNTKNLPNGIYVFNLSISGYKGLVSQKIIINH